MVKTVLFLYIVVVLSATIVCAQITTTPSPASDPKKTNVRPTPTPAPPAAEPFDNADVKTMAEKCVELDTEAGLIDVELYPEQAPETVRNFLNLVVTGAYDTTTFSRVVPGFVVQGGNLGTSEHWGWPLANRSKKAVPDEPNKILHQRGVLSLARSDEPNSGTTHFFILVSDAPSLDGKFAAFGRVTKGMDVVDAINKMPVVEEKPEKPVKLKKAGIVICETLTNQR